MKNIKETISDHVVGKRCNWFRFVEWGTLILYFEDKDIDSSNLLGQRFWIDCAWRLRMHEAILVGSHDEPDDILKELKQLEKQILDSVDVNEFSGDLRLEFHNGVVVETFSYSLAFELWEFRRPDGLRVGVGPKLRPYEKFEDPDKKDGEEET